MKTTKTKRSRLAAVGLIMALAAALGLPPAGTLTASAAPTDKQVHHTKAHLDQARHQLEVLTQRFSVLVDAYDKAQYRLEQTQMRLGAAQDASQRAAAAQDAADAAIADQIRAAYMAGPTNGLDVVLGSKSMSDLAGRIQYLDALTQQQSDKAQAATNAKVQATVTAHNLSIAKSAQADAVVNLNDRQAEVQQLSDQTKSLVADLQKQYQRQLEEQRKAAKRAAARIQEMASSGYTGGTIGDATGPLPPGAACAVQAALSRIGSPYVWGGAGPTVFDCSGLTMWAWAQVGVYMPHYAGSQYAAWSNHPSPSALQPGDLLFFYPGMTHEGMYIGGGKMVAADNPGTGVHIDVLAGYWASQLVGTARPG